MFKLVSLFILNFGEDSLVLAWLQISGIVCDNENSEGREDYSDWHQLLGRKHLHQLMISPYSSGNEVNVLEEELGLGEVDRFLGLEVVVEVNWMVWKLKFSDLVLQ